MKITNFVNYLGMTCPMTKYIYFFALLHFRATSICCFSYFLKRKIAITANTNIGKTYIFEMRKTNSFGMSEKA